MYRGVRNGISGPSSIYPARGNICCRPYLNVVGDNRDVAEVQRGVDLVHDVEWRGLVVVQREDERQRAQGLAWYRGEMLPTSRVSPTGEFVV